MGQKRICLFHANATLDANVDGIGRSIMAGFAANGWATHMVDLSQGDAAEAFGRTVRQLETTGADFFLSVEAMGHMTDLAALLANTGARQLYWALDHPYSGVDRLRQLAPGSVATFPTRSNLECCATYIRPDLTLACAAHGADAAEPRAWAARDIDILFVGNVDGPHPDEIRATWASLAKPWPDVLATMAELWLAEPSTPPEDLARAALMATGATGADGNAFFQIQRRFDEWARPHVRHVTLATLADLPLTLAGRGWDRLAAPGHRLLGPLPSAEVRDLMARSRLVLNILPDYYRSHERVFAAMAAGAAVASSGGGYLANALGQHIHAGDGAIISYLGPLAERGHRLAELWNAPQTLMGMAEAGLEEFRARHTWTRRVQALLPAILS